MYSGQSFSQLAFSQQTFAPLESPAFEAFLNEIESKRCWLLEMNAFPLSSISALGSDFGDAGFGELAFGDAAAGVVGIEQTLRYSTHGYISQAADSPARTWYDGRLTDAISVDRRIVGGDSLGGLARVFGQVKLVNADGALDLLTRNYAINGRRVQILIGRPTDARSAFGVVFSGVVDKAVIALQEATFNLSDGGAKLDVPVNTNTYAGTGGNEGGADLKGKTKPKCFGQVFNISPPLIDSANLIYQVHDGAISDVPAVYDRGISLAKVGGAPGAGQYQVTAAAGTFKLGATPAGTVTCDALGDASGAGYIDKTGDILLRILSALLTSAELEPSSLYQLNGDQPASVGIWTGIDVRTVSAVIDELLAGVGAFGGFARTGTFSVGRIATATGAPKATFTDEDIVDLQREPLPPVVDPIIWRARVGYQKNYTVQQDLAAAVSAARRTFAAAPIRVSKAEDASIRSRHLLAQEYGPTDSLFANQADADTEAVRLFGLWGTLRAPFRVTTRPRGMIRDIGQVVQLKHRRQGLAAGVSGRVIGHSINGDEVTMLVIT
jgi:hypothetical protein